MKIHLLSGFLGSGKTTAIAMAAQWLIEQGKQVAVISNDQGKMLVDGSFFESLHIPNKEVTNGCFCCNYMALDTSIGSLIQEVNPDIIFAESVGSCTDIVATVLKPLLQFRADARTTLSVFADVRLLQMIIEGTGSFDETVQYIYLKQLEEAGIIVVSKTDLVSHDQLLILKQKVSEVYSDKLILYQNSFSKEDIGEWLHALNSQEHPGKMLSLNIDYDLYAAGEAKMGWLDQSVEIFSSINHAMQDAETLINNIYQRMMQQEYSVGHLKFLVNGSIKASFTAGGEPLIVLPDMPAAKVSMLINARVEAGPDILSGIVADAIKKVQDSTGCTITVSDQSAFQPGYPRPAHRF